MSSKDITLLCRSLQVPTSEQIKDALCQAGYDASVEAQRGSLITLLEVELKYASDKMPIKIQFYSEQLHNPQYQMGYEEWRWREDLVQGRMDQKDILRSIFIEAEKDVDAGALKAVVDYVAEQTDALVGFKERLD